MKHEKISIKWKIFLYLLGFTAILLVVLWLIQICYLDSFYKMIKTTEVKQVTSEAIAILQSGDDDISDQIDALASYNNLAIYVADTDGNALYSAEYISTTRLNAIPQNEFQMYYSRALEEGGSTEIEFEGSKNMTFVPSPDEAPPEAVGDEGANGAGDEGANGAGDEGTNGAGDAAENQTGTAGQGENGVGDAAIPENGEMFMQNHGQERIESVIYVNIVNDGTQDLVLFVNSQLTPIDATVHTLRVELVCITAIMIFLSLFVALLISRKISKSMIRINATAKEMAKGKFDVTFDEKDYREIAELSDTLTQTAKELDKNENLKRELIANVSHDLRTPLTMIIAYAEVMRDIPGENTPENVQVVIDESKRLTNLVNDMLDISKLQAGALEKNASVYNLTESIKSVFERYNKLKEQDGYTINFEYDREVEVEADEFKIFQVIYNLVNNAINYAGEDKTVIVKQIVKGKRVRIEVIDHGEGIAEESLPYVWDRYYKVDKTHKRAVMGTGLGLSIVKNILELHHASYGVNSEVGKGSTFWFELDTL